MTDTVQTAATRILYEDPIMITVDAQTVGKALASKLSPYMYNQFLLEQFKAAGAPVGGVIKMRLERGHMFKMKTHPRGPGYFGYMWLSDEAWSIVDQYGRETGLTAHASGNLEN